MLMRVTDDLRPCRLRLRRTLALPVYASPCPELRERPAGPPRRAVQVLVNRSK
jgi:hypothetical protein